MQQFEENRYLKKNTSTERLKMRILNIYILLKKYCTGEKNALKVI